MTSALAGSADLLPVLNLDYATRIARDWNVPASGFGYVTRFRVVRSYLESFGIHQIRGDTILEYWIPTDQLFEFNKHIIGQIEVVAEFRVDSDGTFVRKMSATGRAKPRRPTRDLEDVSEPDHQEQNSLRASRPPS